MKIITTKEKLLSEIQMAERITGKKESLPILSCILIDAGKEIFLRSTNLEAGFEGTLAGEVVEPGIIAVPAAVLSQTIRSISGDKITLSSEEHNLLIESRGTKTLIKAVSHEEFPPLPETASKGGLSLDRARLIAALQSVSYAASPSMIRPDLGSIFVSIDGGSLTCVATDSFRLAEKTVVDGGGKSEGELLIPLKHALELVHILEHIDVDKVTLYSDESQLSVQGAGVRYVSRVVDSNFPNYKEIVPKKFATEATVLKSDFAEMLRKARVFAGNDMHVGFHVYPKKKIFSALARSADVGEMSDSIDAALSGDDLDINFHIGYLSDCLGAIDGESLKLGFSGPGRPLVIRSASDQSFMYLVMPLNR
ncbi:MAG TPA: DNA polymerase III subunit beta [Candidatus Paceibacterota bacterium]|nr:DNA polymerase III subunit beta [Candidatus Paceibacterota bacterium]